MYHNLADEIAIEQLMNWDGYAGNNFIIDAHTESRQEDFKHLYPYPKEVCPFPFYTLAITVNGDITVCCVDWNKSTKVGNVFQNFFKVYGMETRYEIFA
jgi:hypothetical protein